MSPPDGANDEATGVEGRASSTLDSGGTHSTNDAGQVVGVGPGVATEWSDGRIVNLEAGRAPRLALPMVSMTPDSSGGHSHP